MDPKQIIYKDVDWILSGSICGTVVNTHMNLQLYQRRRIS